MYDKVGRELIHRNLNNSKHCTALIPSSGLHKLPALVRTIDGIRDGESGPAADEFVCVIAHFIHPTPLIVCELHQAEILVAHVVNVALSSRSVLLLHRIDI